MTFTGSLLGVNEALSHLSYRPGQNYNGKDIITIACNIFEGIGTEAPLSTSKQIYISVISVNDAPVITVPLFEDGTKVHRWMKMAPCVFRELVTTIVQRFPFQNCMKVASNFFVVRVETMQIGRAWPGDTGLLGYHPGRAASPGYFEEFGWCTVF